jgi:AraC-like DNA-binding protein
MPSCSVRTSSDPDEYRATIRPASVELSVTARGQFAASVTRLDFDRLWLQRGRESLPRIWHVGPSRERAIIGFLTGGKADAVRNGARFRHGDLALLSRRHDYRYRTLGPVEWGAMSLPFADMAEIERGVAGRDLMPRQDEELVAPPAAAMAKLLRLHAAAGDLAASAPEVIANLEAARGLEQTLVEAMVDCLVVPDRHEDTAARRRHIRIMQRFHAALEASHDRAVYLPELCARIGASGRTLRLCCHEHLGMSPKQYLLLRRLHLAREALRQTAPTMTVTDIATRFGFWELGRFSVRYKALFGESPSATRRGYASAA